jgi:hypothetical protein
MRMPQKFGLVPLVLCLAIAACEGLSIAQVFPHPVGSTYALNVPGQTEDGRPLVYWVDREQGIALTFAYSRRTRRRSLGQIIVFKPNSETCPTSDSLDSPAKRELKTFSLDPDEK